VLCIGLQFIQSWLLLGEYLANLLFLFLRLGLDGKAGAKVVLPTPPAPYILSFGGLGFLISSSFFIISPILFLVFLLVARLYQPTMLS